MHICIGSITLRIKQPLWEIGKMKYNSYYKLKSLINRFMWRVFFSSNFEHYGNKVNIFFPENIIGEEYIRLGDGVYIGYRASIIVRKWHDIKPSLNIGADTKIRPFFHVVCAREVSIGSDVIIADKVFISDNTHEYRDILSPISQQGMRYINPVIIGNSSWIGENVSIIGASIGKHSVIGANSVVITDVPDYSVAVGCPAKIVKRFDISKGEWVKVKT